MSTRSVDSNKKSEYGTKTRPIGTRQLATMAMLIAVGVALSFIEIPGIFPAAPYLAYDPSGVAIYLAAFLFGPLAGSVVAIATCLLSFLLHGSTGGLVGVLMNVAAALFFAIPAGIIYRRNKTKKGAVIALVVSSIVMVVGNVLLNLLVTPLYLGASYREVAQLIVPALLPFNALKALVNAVVTFLVYKPLSKVVHLFEEK